MRLTDWCRLLALPLCLVACGGDGGDGGDGPAGGAAVSLAASVPANGATGVSAATTTVELTYSAEVDFTNGKADFGGSPCGIADFSKSGNVMTFKIPQRLERGKVYTLSIPAGFFVAKGGGTPVPAHAVTFSTAEKTSVSGDGVAQGLVTPGASAQAVKLYDYLRSVYGDKLISSTIANVNWNLCEAEMVHAATGKWPAMATVDYLHFYTLYNDAKRNPYYKSWRVDYDDISQFEEWWNAGGIVSACWHWNVPRRQADEYGKDDYSCTPGNGDIGNTAFRPRNIFVDGSWEQSIADEDLALLASLLKKFQEAGIPVVWRPLHEASGNAATGGTAWFWWGVDGAETYVRLWRKMFDYFKAQGLNNLIWVWTTQTGYSYDASKGIVYDDEWYPGDEYVDIVGRDEYKMTTEMSAAEFEALVAKYPGKIVTLSECGSVGKLSEQWAAGAQWSWAMPWYDYDVDNGKNPFSQHQHANAEWWQDAMDCEFVVSRDDLPSFK